MLVTTPEIARRLERAEALNLARQMEAVAALRPGLDARVARLAGGTVAVAGPSFDRKLNHATGLGIDEPLTDAVLAEVERLCHGRGVPAEIDLSPHADGSVLPLLATRGYAVNAYTNVYAAETGAAPSSPPPPGVAVRQLASGGDGEFVRLSVAAFAAQARARPTALLELLALVALERTDTLAFIATVDGEPAGAAALALLPVPGGLTGHLHIAGTLDRYRGRGVQAALIHARLAAAAAAGADLASITARPWNASARNAERAGFRLAYTKATFAKPVP
ncbi:GNAT family N-acetyltransferase [Arenibaculum pallidiluteum]|uniref:GNAT family N-acetyltransferase n=1 Tax=Arenibaculum pallidiluteum TaxID=2812559 RepID=UPI001A962972|nr:GNAT family N-acetyltransferase [Arenibaculum pallidiluteum]